MSETSSAYKALIETDCWSAGPLTARLSLSLSAILGEICPPRRAAWQEIERQHRQPLERASLLGGSIYRGRLFRSTRSKIANLNA